MRRWLVLLVVVPLAAAPLAAEAAAAAPRPRLGDWEGRGPHGLPLSFELQRRHGRVVVSDSTFGDPLYCRGRELPTLANPYPNTTYLGPGAEPRVRINWPADTVEIRVGMGAPFAPELDGSLFTSTRMTLSEPLPQHLPQGCGWGSLKRLTWRVAPAHRIPVAPGKWSGPAQVTGGGSGTVTLHVNYSGRIVDNFQVTVNCPAGSASWGVGPATVGEFISAAGRFVDAAAHPGFSGTFHRGDSVSGRFRGPIGGGCGSGMIAFTASPATG